MAEQKIFAGPRIRRIRKERDLTQTAMAEAIGISPSYLNLIERNQRPLTVQLILKLAATFKIDLEDLQGEAGGSVADLREVFADPLLSAELPGPEELIEVAEAAPNAAAAMVKLYRAYREGQERLTDLSALLSKDGRTTATSGARLPLDEVQEVLASRANHFAQIEEEAESFLNLLKPADDLEGALKGWLRSQHGVTVRVLPVATMPNWRRRYDRHSQRLFISERLSPFDQLREVAMEAALLRMQVAIAAEIEGLKLSSQEARRIARFEMARYAAHALMMPYQPFLQAAQKARHDIDVLRSRFPRLVRTGRQPADNAEPAGRSGHSVFHARSRSGRKPLPPRRRGRLSAVALRRRLPETARFTRRLPSRSKFWSKASKCPTARPSWSSPARWKARMARSTNVPAARQSCSAATSLSKTKSSTARRCLARAPRSARPAACASAPAASPAPRRRSPSRWGWMKW